MIEDSELLRLYAESRSEEAFAELVRRRIGLVYAVALRRTRGDVHAAEDAAQLVFVDLARKAAALSRHPVIIGWLCRSALFAASDVMRNRQRHLAREQKVHLMQDINQTGPREPDWTEVRPALDQALAKLNEWDRGAVLMRFFDGRPFAEIGAQLKLTENAARMRVERALEKLRVELARHGVKSSSALLIAGLAGQAVEAAPAGLASSITGAALSAGTKAAVGLAQFFTMTALKTTMVSAVVVGAAATTLVLFRAQRSPDSASIAIQPATIPVSAATETTPPASSPPKEAIPDDSLPTKMDMKRWTAMANDPALLRRSYDQERKKVIHVYAAFFRQMKFSPEQTEKLIKLLVDEREVPADVFVADIENGGNPTNDYNKLRQLMGEVKSTQAGIDGEIESLLGDDGYAQYQSYLQNQHLLRSFAVIDRLQQSLENGGNLLSDDQNKRLQRLLNGSGHVSSDVIEQAKLFLSPAQQEALQEIRDTQIANELRNQQGILPPVPGN
ncbi:MAG TPA: sigma-70 family RNA polymerase sigma factor [Opitutaceae bacterium]|jgi:RNA polymerase sigma factor (sigma-70 family)|nr:sigma-70 family RNA polymerase sigma factor [Opitutaceae bacterium]